jgi:luciferase-type oxidoreductase
MFAPGQVTLGVFFPIEAFECDEPTMRHQERLARRAEELGFAALWVRDVPLRDPNFGDLGQVYDPWVYLGWITAQTRTIALATGSIILPIRHPLHTAKEAASVDQLSGGRLVLGVASGDRPVEFPAFGVDPDQRDALFRENLRLIREVLAYEFPTIRSSYGTLFGTADLVPKPVGRLRSWSLATAGKAWNGSPSIRTAGSPTRGPSSSRRNLPRAGVPPWQPCRRACSNRWPSHSTSI